ncbi:MAG: cation:proton antiporter [Patescibacteria group bacterium]
MPAQIITSLLVLVSAAFVGGAVLKLLKQPPVVGYLISGLTVSILFGVSDTNVVVKFLSELGIVLLLFTLGLEFSWEKLKKVANIAIIGGILQILLTTVLIAFILVSFGFALFPAYFAAAAFSLSSTAIVIKILTDRGELDSLPGEIMTAWLIVQDLAVLPMMLVLPLLGKITQSGNSIAGLTLSILNGLFLSTVVLSLFLVLGKELIPRLMTQLARLESRELLLTGVFAIALAGAYFTQYLGLSAALGAFLSGLLISRSHETHAVFSEVRPLRDLFALLFFTTLGFVLPAGFFFAHFGTIFALTLLVIAIKFLVSMFLTFYLGHHAKTSFLVGIGLIEVGEFAFVLASLGLSEGLVDTTIYGLIVSVGLLSILLMPPIYLGAPVFYNKLRDYSRQQLPFVYTRFFATSQHHDTLPELPFQNHVVLCGYGRVGGYIGRALTMAHIPFVVVEINQHKAASLRNDGFTVVFGDPADIDILDYAQVDKAKAVVVAIPDLATQEQVITNSLRLNKKVSIYCRTHNETHQKYLKDLGVLEVIQPEFEASIAIAGKILKIFGQPSGSIDSKVSRLKIEHGLG